VCSSDLGGITWKEVKGSGIEVAIPQFVITIVIEICGNGRPKAGDRCLSFQGSGLIFTES
jgi:hypothetical protein